MRDEWKRAVRSGRTFTTTGPLVSLLVEGRGLGAEFHLPAGGGTLEVEAVVESVYPVHELQLVVSGRVAASERSAGAGSAWIAARCSSRLLAQHQWRANHLAAHTSPVYVTCGGQELFSPPDAAFMLTLIEGGLTWLDTLSVSPTPEREHAVREVFHQAHDHLSHRLGFPFPSSIRGTGAA